MSSQDCVICCSSGVNLYKCFKCSLKICGDCAHKVKTCPQCRSDLKMVDEHCSKVMIGEGDCKLEDIKFFPTDELEDVVDHIYYYKFQDVYVPDFLKEYTDGDGTVYDISIVNYQMAGVKRPWIKKLEYVLKSKEEVNPYLRQMENGREYYVMKLEQKVKRVSYLDMFGPLGGLGPSEQKTEENFSGVKNFRCRYCTKEYTKEGNMKNHLTNKHPTI